MDGKNALGFRAVMWRCQICGEENPAEDHDCDEEIDAGAVADYLEYIYGDR